MASGSDTTGAFEVVAFGADAESAYQSARSAIGDGFALRRVPVPEGMPFGEFMDLAREEQRLNDPWRRVPDRDSQLARHKERLDALPAAWSEAVRVAARFDPDERVCCFVELDPESSALERLISTAQVPSDDKAFVFFGLRHR